MGLDIGIISIQYLERPSGHSYRFMWEMAIEASVAGYMSGDGNNWGYFYKHEVRELLDAFAKREGLSSEDEQTVWAWVESLQWMDNDLIELHFNW